MEDQQVDPITDELDGFVIRLMRSELSLRQQKRSFQIKNLLVDIERVGDMAEDIAQFAQERLEKNIPFTDEAVAELDNFWRRAYANYTQALQAFKDKDKTLAETVCRVESEFDVLYWQARQRHIERLECAKCKPGADVIFSETLRLLERISDHADNIGVSVSRN
jgi:phosphate:Na+ symporter